jgi:hypothetical protein
MTVARADGVTVTDREAAPTRVLPRTGRSRKAAINRAIRPIEDPLKEAHDGERRQTTS